MGDIKENVIPSGVAVVSRNSHSQETKGDSGPFVTVKSEEEPPPSIGPEQPDWRAAYEARFGNPAFQTQAWRNVWHEWTIDHKEVRVEIPSCPYTEDELRELQQVKRMPIYVPQGVSLSTLHALFTEFKLDERKDFLSGRPMEGGALSQVEKYSKYGYSTAHQNGWIDVEREVTALQVGTSPEEARRTFFKANREEMNLQAYLIASMFSRTLTGHFFDEDSMGAGNQPWCRLGGTVLRTQYDTPDVYATNNTPAILCKFWIDEKPGLRLEDSLEHLPQFGSKPLFTFGHRSVGYPNSSPISKIFSPK